MSAITHRVALEIWGRTLVAGTLCKKLQCPHRNPTYYIAASDNRPHGVWGCWLDDTRLGECPGVREEMTREL